MKRYLSCFVLSICLLSSLSGLVQAQVNPTPIIITLPAGTPTTAVSTPTVESGATTPAFTPTVVAGDRLEPNNTTETAVLITLWEPYPGLTLPEGDVDFFTFYAKAGQTIQVDTIVYNGLDTRAVVYWGDLVIAENDDRSPNDPGSQVIFTAVSEGLYLVKVERATVYTGGYDLLVTAVSPTSTPTMLPTMTPTPTGTPLPSPTPVVQPDTAEPNNTPATAHAITPGSKGSYSIGQGDVDYFTFIAKAGNRYSCETITNQVDTWLVVSADSAVITSSDDRSPGRIDSYVQWQATTEQLVILELSGRGGSMGGYELVCQIAVPPPPIPGATLPIATAVVSSTTSIIETAVLTNSHHLPLTLHQRGALPPADPTFTPVRLTVYYDLNGDRAPSPGEGIPNVSVLAVSAGGQRIAQVFTNLEGEAVFNATADIARLVVPFVSAWSATLSRSAATETVNISLGLPAVRIPVFLPLTEVPE